MTSHTTNHTVLEARVEKLIADRADLLSQLQERLSVETKLMSDALPNDWQIPGELERTQDMLERDIALLEQLLERPA